MPIESPKIHHSTSLSKMKAEFSVAFSLPTSGLQFIVDYCPIQQNDMVYIADLPRASRSVNAYEAKTRRVINVIINKLNKTIYNRASRRARIKPHVGRRKQGLTN